MTDDQRHPHTTSGTMQRVARVLIVDDEPLVAESMHLVLADEFEVSFTTDPAEALAWLTSGDWYDVILCDIMMPRMNGVELRNRVNADNPALASRIVFVTGGILMPSIQWMLDGIPNQVLAKPFDFVGLRDFIRRRTLVAAPSPRASRP
jgi:CheY-like chemotaxis protein